MWQRARNVAARAQTFGLPWVLPGGALAKSIVITRDAKRAYSAAGDIWVHDLERRTSTKLVEGAGATLVALAGDTLVYAGKTALVTRTDGHEQRFERAVTALVAAGRSIVWLEAGGAFVLRNGMPVALPATDGSRLAIAPDGSQVAVFGARGAQIIVLGETPSIVFRHTGDTWDVRWSADGMIAIADQRGGFVVHDGAERELVPYTTRAALFAAGTPVFAGTDNVVYREGVLAPSKGSGTFHLTHAALLEHGAVFDTAKRELVVTGPVTERIIRLPGTPTALAAAGSRVVVAVPSHVLIYDLSVVLPRVVPIPPSRFGYQELLDERSLLSAQLTGEVVDWRVYDLDGGTSRSLGSTGLARPVALAADGSYFACKQVSPAEILILRTGQPAIHLPAATQNVRAVSAALAVLVETNALRTLAIADGKITTLLEAEIVAVAASETFVVASLPDRLVRIELATGARREVIAKAAITTIDRSGVVHFAAGQDVMRWDGEQLVLLAHLPAAITGFSAIPNRLVVLDEHAGAWTVDGTARRLLPPRTDVAAWSSDGTHAVARSLDGEVSYFDLAARDTWQLPLQATQVMMSPSGRRLVAVFEGGVGVYDRAAHEQSINPFTNSDARGEWLSFGANALAVASLGAGKLPSIVTKLAKLADTGAQLNAANDLRREWSSLTPAERAQVGLQLGFWGLQRSLVGSHEVPATTDAVEAKPARWRQRLFGGAPTAHETIADVVGDDALIAEISTLRTAHVSAIAEICATPELQQFSASDRAAILQFLVRDTPGGKGANADHMVEAFANHPAAKLGILRTAITSSFAATAWHPEFGDLPERQHVALGAVQKITKPGGSHVRYALTVAGGHVVEVVQLAPGAPPKGYRHPTPVEVQHVLAAQPPGALVGIAKLYLTNTPYEGAVLGPGRVTGGPVPSSRFNEGVTGLFTPRETDGFIKVRPIELDAGDPQAGLQRWQQTLTHELAHTFDFARGGRKKFAAEHDPAYADAIARDGRAISGYAESAKHDASEDFAETYSLYVAVRGSPREATMRALYPNRFAYLDGALSGHAPT
jgi:Domain of unknown function (DUF4781)